MAPPTQQTDKLIYFPLRGRAEVIRILYKVAGKEYEDVNVTMDEWADKKKEMPMAQIPTYETKEGSLCQSNVIARHVARKLGLVGSTQWQETQHDLVVECMQEAMHSYGTPNIYLWLVFKSVPEPENKEEVIQKAKEKLISTLNYIQSIQEKNGTKFIVGDEIGLADIWVLCGLEFCKLACPEFETLTPWTKQHLERVRNHPKVKNHLESRPDAMV